MLKYLIKLPKKKEKLKDSTNTDDSTSTSTAKKLLNTDNRDTEKKDCKENVESDMIATTISKSPKKSMAKSPNKTPAKSPTKAMPKSPTKAMPKSPTKTPSRSSTKNAPSSPTKSVKESVTENESNSPSRSSPNKSIIIQSTLFQQSSQKRKRESSEESGSSNSNEDSTKKSKSSNDENNSGDGKSTSSSKTNSSASSTKDKERFPCDICDKEYVNKNGLYRHRKTNHGILDVDTSVTTSFLEKDEEKEESEGEEESDEEVYEVERVVDYAYCKQSEEGLYYVKWLGWPEDQNTWEPIANLSCREKLIQFYNERVEARKVATPAEKRKLALPPDPRESRDLRDLFLSKYWVKPSQAELEDLYREQLKGKTAKLQPELTLWKDMETLAVATKENDKRVSQIITQLNLRELDKVRRNQLADIKAWEKKINLVEKDAHVSVVNDVDLEGPPNTMEYINAYKASEGIELPDDPPLGCACSECKNGSSDCCPGQAGYDFPYTANGKLRLNVGFPIYECNKRCECPPNCRNRVVQKGRTVKMAIFRTSNGCGWGVKSLERIKEGLFVVSYVGEVITSEEAERRGKDYDAAGRTYLFDLDFNLGDDNPYTVDAAFYGNLSHFINHSCDPNLSIFNVYINCLDPNLPQLCLFARRDIEKGEELTFDYCQNTGSLETDNPTGGSPVKSPQSKSKEAASASSPSAVVRSPTAAVEAPTEKSGYQSECRCGSKNCRKVLF